MTGTQTSGNLLYDAGAIEAMLTFMTGTGDLSKRFHELFESEFQKRINHPNSNQRHNDMHHFVLFTITDLRKMAGIAPVPSQYTACFTTTAFTCREQWKSFLSQHAGDHAEGYEKMMDQIFEEIKATPPPTAPANPHEVPDLWNFFYDYFELFRIPRPNKKRYDDLDQPGRLECIINAILDKIEAIAKKTGLKDALHHGSMATADVFHDMEYGPPNTFSSLITV